MKEKSRAISLVSTVAVIVCLFSLSCTAYAAPPAATQKSATQQLQPAAAPAASVLNPNAPPKGTITINASSKANVNASTWYTGSYQYIQWTCSGTRSNLVDVTLWKNNQQKVIIGTGIATGQTAYSVPGDTINTPGNYELRIISEDDSRVEARLAVTIVATTLIITKPNKDDIWYTGGTYPISWQIQGTQGSVNISLSTLTSINSINVGTGIAGGSMQYTVPSSVPPGEYYLYVNSKDAPGVMGGQHLFVQPATLTVTSPKASDKWAPGNTYGITWQFMGNPGPLKIEFINASSSIIIADNVQPGAGGSGWYNWKVFPLKNGDYQVRITGQSSGAPSSTSPTLRITNPFIKYSWSADPNASMAMPYAYYGQPFTSYWQSFACGDKVNITITDDTANKNTIASNTAEAVRGKVYFKATQYSLSNGSGQYSWIPPAPPDPNTGNRWYHIHLDSSGGCSDDTDVFEYQ